MHHSTLIKLTDDGYEVLNPSEETLTGLGKKARTVMRVLPVLEAIPLGREAPSLLQNLPLPRTPRWLSSLLPPILVVDGRPHQENSRK